MRSLYRALLNAPSGSSCKGILWYQGENDSGDSPGSNEQVCEDKGQSVREDTYAEAFCGLHEYFQLAIAAITAATTSVHIGVAAAVSMPMPIFVIFVTRDPWAKASAAFLIG